MKRIRPFTKIMCSILLVIFASCEKGDEATPTTAQTSPAADGKIVLASFMHPSGVQTDFYQINNSTIVIQSTFPVDEGNGYASIEKLKEYTGKINDLRASGKSYADIYITLAGNKVNQESLNAIKNADLLCQKTLKAAPTVSTTANSNPVNETVAATNNVSALNPPMARTETSCSSDLFNDNYGASWFLTNFCTSCQHIPFFGFVFIPPTGIRFGQIGTNVKPPKLIPIPLDNTLCVLTVMAADFNQGVNVQFHNNCKTGPHVICNTIVAIRTIPPRNISTIQFSSGVSATDALNGSGIEVVSTSPALTCDNRIHYIFYNDPSRL